MELRTKKRKHDNLFQNESGPSSQQTSSYSGLKKDKITQSRNRRVIAEFLEDVPDNEGWWYHIPKLRDHNPKHHRPWS